MEFRAGVEAAVKILSGMEARVLVELTQSTLREAGIHTSHNKYAQKAEIFIVIRLVIIKTSEYQLILLPFRNHSSLFKRKLDGLSAIR